MFQGFEKVIVPEGRIGTVHVKVDGMIVPVVGRVSVIVKVTASALATTSEIAKSMMGIPETPRTQGSDPGILADTDQMRNEVGAEVQSDLSTTLKTDQKIKERTVRTTDMIINSEEMIHERDTS